MKIDLHCHTKAIKKGDGQGRNVTASLFKEKIQNADIKIVAITNHNAFDFAQYKEFSSATVDCCLVWPGVEIDVKDIDSNRWHLIIVVNPKEAEIFSYNVAKLFNNDNLDECTHTLDDIYKIFKEHDAIYIAHFDQKKPAATNEDCKKLELLIGDSSRVFKETASEKSMSFFANFQYNVLVGSDVKDWTMYEKCSFTELKLNVDSFEQFCLLSKRDENVVESLLNKKNTKELTAHPSSNTNLQVKIFADINIIFGQKGTGKSQIIKTLYEDMQSKGFNCVGYFATDRECDFDNLLKNGNVEIDLKKMKANACVEEFKTIEKWTDVNPELFTNYVNWKKTEGNNANKKRMGITSSSQLPAVVNEKEKPHKEAKRTIDAIYQDILNIGFEEYLSKKDSKLLSKLISDLKSSIYDYRRTDLIEENAVNLVNFSINKIKFFADLCTNSVSKPSTTGLINFVESRLTLRTAVRTILNNLMVGGVYESEAIGTIEGKGEIYIKTEYKMLSSESKADEFALGIRKLKEVKTILENIKNNVFDSKLADTMYQLKLLIDELGIKDIKPFVGCLRKVVDASGDLYKPSNGEKGMLLLQRALKNEVDAYFLDEPELGMGNSYVDTTIRPMLIALSKRHKFVVVATHNANLAVRTLPYLSIYRMHKNGKYSTYFGNPFIDKLENIDDKSDVLNWAEESLKSLEGSRDAFYERKYIYESSRS